MSTWIIAVLEDDYEIMSGIKELLEMKHFQVKTARTVAEFQNMETADLYLLDVILPDGDGFQVCRQIRQNSDAPVIFITSCDDQESVVKGLDIGGDDYITKPFYTGELTVVVGIVILMLVILGIGLWRISSIGKSDLPGKMLSLEQENARLQKELKLEHTYNENQKKQLQDFIENIAHQVKTPLTALTVKLGLLKEVSGKSQDETEAGLNSEGGKEEDNIPSKSHEQGDQLLGDCFYNVFKIKDFITRLLNISRLESGKVIMAEDEVSLEALLQESINGSGIDEERIVMDRNESETPTKDTILYADEGWLIEAFVNLISNCEDYIRENPEGRIFIDTEQTKESVTVVISDNGMGLKESDIPHIFNRFETTRDSRDFHVGIGLNLSKLIIDSHHGKIHAGNSEEHGGAEFRVMLPIYHMKSKVDMQSVL